MPPPPSSRNIATECSNGHILGRLSLRDLGVWEPWFYLGATLFGVNLWRHWRQGRAAPPAWRDSGSHPSGFADLSGAGRNLASRSTDHTYQRAAASNVVGMTGACPLIEEVA
jgi:hypothetical protein